MRRILRYIGVAVLAATLAGCGKEDNDAKTDVIAKPVRVAPVGRSDIVRTITLTGIVKPVEDTVVSAEVAGRIKTKSVELGMEIEVDAQLAKIDDDDYKKAFAQAEAALAVANANLEQNKATQERLQEDYETNKRLLEQGVIAPKVFDDISTKLAEVNALVKLSEARVTEATIARDIASVNKDKTSVKCPLDTAIVSEVMFDKGGYVVPGTPLVRLVNIDKVWIEVGVGEKSIAAVEERMKEMRKKSPDKKAYVDFTVPNMGKTKYKGSVESISPSADPATGTFTVKVSYNNSSRLLKGGMFALVTLPVNTKADTVVVPRSAIDIEASRRYVFVLDKNKVRKFEVETGVTQGDVVEITQGLRGDETVVVDGADVLVDGDEVKVLKDAGPEGDKVADDGRSPGQEPVLD